MVFFFSQLLAKTFEVSCVLIFLKKKRFKMVVQFGLQLYSWLNRMIIYGANWTRQLLLWWQTELDPAQFYYHSPEIHVLQNLAKFGERLIKCQGWEGERNGVNCVTGEGWSNIRELKQQRFWATVVNRKWTFCITGQWFGWNSWVNRLYKWQET